MGVVGLSRTIKRESKPFDGRLILGGHLGQRSRVTPQLLIFDDKL